MFLLLIRESFARRTRRKLLALVAVALGISVAVATVSVSLDVGDKLNRELRRYGANIAVMPQADTLPLEIGGVDARPVAEGNYIREADLPKLKSIFWKHNILGFAPFFYLPVRVGGRDAVLMGTWFEKEVPTADGSFATGVRTINPWWRVEGQWVRDDEEACLVGVTLAARLAVQPGSTVELETSAARLALPVRGLLSTGGAEDEQIVAPLTLAQRLAGRLGEVRRVQVSALTNPEDEFGRRDPETMTPAEYDRWYCTPYVSSIARQIKEVLPGTEARPIRQIAQTESTILNKIRLLMLLVTLAALAAAALAVSSTLTATVIERKTEIGLMKAIGASDVMVGWIFLAEAALIALSGGVMGFFGGIGLAQLVGLTVFQAPIQPKFILLPVAVVLSLMVALGGSWWPLERAARYEAAQVLRGE